MRRRPKLGQNFLVDASWQKKIVDAFEPRGDFAEIGPGKGALTQHLEKKYSGFYVFEIDPEMAEFHRDAKSYQLFQMSFLDWDFKIDEKEIKNFSFIGNLPYESGTAMLLKIVEKAHLVDHFVFMLQREVIDRIVSKEAARTYGALSVLCQGQYDIKNLGVVKPGAFRPAPKVDSAVITARRKLNPHPQTEDYRRFIFKAFQHKRKTLRNSLGSETSSEALSSFFVEKAWPETRRAEEIAVEEWPEMYERLSTHE